MPFERIACIVCDGSPDIMVECHAIGVSAAGERLVESAGDSFFIQYLCIACANSAGSMLESIVDEIREEKSDAS